MNFVLARAPQTDPRWLECHLGLVEKVARQVYRRLPPYVDLRDLIQEGMVGLLEAGSKIASEGLDSVQSKTYVVARVKGSMLDWLRRCDWVSRGGRRRERQLQHSEEHLAQRLGRRPKTEEMVAHTGLSAPTLQRYRSEAVRCALVSLEDVLVQQGAPSNLAFDNTLQSIERHCLQEYVERLPARERAIIILHYFEDRKLSDLAQSIGVSQARLSQLHKQALARLQEWMAPVPPRNRSAYKPFERSIYKETSLLARRGFSGLTRAPLAVRRR